MKKILTTAVLAILACSVGLSVAAKPKARVVTVAYQVPTTKVQGVADQIRANMDNALNQLGTVVLVDKSAYEAEIVKNGQTMQAAQSDFLGGLAGKISCADYVVYCDVMEAVVTRVFKDKVIETKNKNTGVVTSTTKKIWYWEGKLSAAIKVYDLKTGVLVYNSNPVLVKPYEEDWSAPPIDPMTGLAMLPDFNVLRPDLVTGSIGAVVSDSVKLNLYNLFRPVGKVVDIQPEDEKGKNFMVTIDIGQDCGVKDWEKYQVLLIDPTTLNPLGSPQKSQIVGVMKIKSVLGNQAKGTVNKKDAAKIKAGMDVKAKLWNGSLLFY